MPRTEVETPVETFRKFAKTPGWKNAPEKVIASDLFSMNNESNLFLNPSFYEERDGRLFDPVRERIVAGTADGDEVEEGVIKQLEDWFLTHNSGIAVWISPRGNGIRPYPEEQITIYRIAYKANRQKVLLLTSHQFKANFRNPEEIRKFIFPEEDREKSIFEILGWLKRTSQKRVETSLSNVEERKKRAEYYAHQYVSGTPIEWIAYDMTQTGFLGENPIGCGGNTTITSFFSFTETTTLTFGFEDQYGSLTFSCPKCGAMNTRPSGQLISNCQHCGGDVRC
jgi:hypothetical protein